LDEYRLQKEALLRWYERVLQTPLLHDESIHPSSLQRRRGQLRAERFIVAICGQMNGGKSTLMNAMLFSDEILPTSPTTMTAKITLMEGAHTPSIEATLYSADEWPAVLRASNSDEYSAREFAEAREAAREAGLKESHLLRRPARVHTEEGLGALLKFVGVPDDGGLYTPYVKSVVLRADLPWLHQVNVADTPGTNDPNPERDKLTQKWIQQADAVIYVTYVGQAGMDATDVRFLDENLLHVPPQRRIIAVNKCDTVAGAEEAVWSHLRGLQHSDDLRMRALFEDEEQVVLVSGLAGLIARTEAAGRPLGEELSYYRDDLAARGWLENDRHGVGQLCQKVEDRILANRGDAIIESHSGFLQSLFERAQRHREKEIGELEEHLEIIAADGEEREAERLRINETIDSLGEVILLLRGEVGRKLDAALSDAQEMNSREIEGIVNDTFGELRKVKNIGSIGDQAAWLLSSNIHRKRSAFSENLRALVSTVEAALTNAEQQLSERLTVIGIGRRRARQHILPISAYNICQEALRELEEHLRGEGLEHVVKDAVGWWSRTWNTKGGRQQAIERLEPLLGRQLSDTIEAINEKARNKLTSEIAKAIRVMEDAVQEMLDGRLEVLNAFLDEDREDAATRREILDRLEALGEQLAELRVLKEQLDRELL